MPTLNLTGALTKARALAIAFSALVPAVSYAQTPPGPLLQQNLLGEIQAAGPTAQATARANLGVTSGPCRHSTYVDAAPACPRFHGLGARARSGALGRFDSFTS